MSTVVSIRMSVDLPAPSGPTSPKTSPRGTLNVWASTAVIERKRLVSSRASIAFSVPWYRSVT